MSAISSCEVTIKTFTIRAGINVQEHLLDIHHRHYHITVDDVTVNIRQRNISHELCHSSLCSCMETFKGDQICLHMVVNKMWQHTSEIRQFQHSYNYHGTGTWWGFTDNHGIEATQYGMNKLHHPHHKVYCGEKSIFNFGKLWELDPLGLFHD